MHVGPPGGISAVYHPHHEPDPKEAACDLANKIVAQFSDYQTAKEQLDNAKSPPLSEEEYDNLTSTLRDKMMFAYQHGRDAIDDLLAMKDKIPSSYAMAQLEEAWKKQDIAGVISHAASVAHELSS